MIKIQSAIVVPVALVFAICIIAMIQRTAGTTKTRRTSTCHPVNPLNICSPAVANTSL
jgi:hypothetical protein